MRFEKFINEALKPSQFRMYVKGWNKEYLKELFDGKYRIYLEMNSTKPRFVNNDTAKMVSKRLQDYGFSLEDYVAGLCKKDGDTKNLYKIGKVLTKYETPDFLIQRFNNDPDRAANKKTSIMVVISRHPYDIAGMSTDRGWTSCMALPGDKQNPEGGGNCDYIEGEIKDGAIIAYLVNKNDPNISKPIARMLIKSYYNEDEPSKKILVSGKVYGTDISGFTETVDAWLDKQAKEVGIYIMGDNSYQDAGYDKKKVIGTSEQVIELMKKRISQFGSGIYKDLDIFVHSQILPLFNYFTNKQFREELHNTGFEDFLHKELSSNKLSKEQFISTVRLVNRDSPHAFFKEDNFDEWVINNAFSVNVVYYIRSKMDPFDIRHDKPEWIIESFTEVLDRFNPSQSRKDELIKIFKVIYLGVDK